MALLICLAAVFDMLVMKKSAKTQSIKQKWKKNLDMSEKSRTFAVTHFE